MSVGTDLLQLWDEYRASKTRVFQPTMTDFMEWLRKRVASSRTEQDVKGTRTWRHHGGDVVLPVYPDAPELLESVKGDGRSEPSVVQRRVGGFVTEQDETEIRRLYNQGYSVYYISNQLGLNIEPEQIRRIGEGA